MSKHLSVILKQYNDVISGKVPASTVMALSTGKDPGVDYAGKMPDERDFVASHSVEKFPDRNGNGDDVFNASNIKVTEPGRHGHLPNPKSVKVYQQSNEEFDLDEAKDEGEYGYEGDMAITQLKTIIRNSQHLIGMLKPDTDLPEWVQAKITKAEDYISTSHDYLMSEMTEENEFSEAKCNMTEAGTMCEVHGMKGCNKEETKSASDKEPRYNGKDKKNVRQLLTDKKTLQEKAESVVQQKLMAMALAHKRGEMDDASEQVKKLAASMTEKQLTDFAKTKHTGLPKRVQKEESAAAPTPITFPATNSREGFKL